MAGSKQTKIIEGAGQRRISMKEVLADKSFTAKRFVEKLKTYQSPAELKKYHRYFKFDEDQVR